MLVTKLELLFFQINNWSEEEKSKFYRHLSLNMTVAIRSIWSDEELEDKAKIIKIKWINEVHHRIINRLADLADERPIGTDLQVWEMIQDYAKENPAIKSELSQSIISAYDSNGDRKAIDCLFCGKTLATYNQGSQQAQPTAEDMYQSGKVPVPNLGWFCSQECASKFEKMAKVHFQRNKDGNVDYYKEN